MDADCAAGASHRSRPRRHRPLQPDGAGGAAAGRIPDRHSVRVRSCGGAGNSTHRREVQVRSRIATLVYVNVGEPPAAVELVDLRSRHVAEPADADRRHSEEHGARGPCARAARVTLFDASGAVVGQTSIPDVPVLPESEREVAIAPPSIPTSRRRRPATTASKSESTRACPRSSSAKRR